MGINLGLIFLLASCVLFAIAAVVHFHSSHLSLPISPVITILTILLPIASFLNSYIYPSILHSSRSSTNRIQQLSPIILQIIQALVTTVLATLLFEGIVPSPGLECVLENDWMRMFRAHDGESIRLIQDTLKCCGLNSIKDRAYPFSKGGASTCAETYGRTLACKGPWRAAVQSSAGMDFGVVLAVGLMQILGLLMMREGNSWWTAWRTVGWRRLSSRRRESRPLLAAIPDDDEQVIERQDTNPRGYQALPENEEAGPRVAPSAIHHERNAWQDNRGGHFTDDETT